MTFYGLGYHQHRERWLHEEWFWYQTSTNPDLLRQRIDKEKAKEILEQRLADIRPYLDDETQSERGKLFDDLLADLTDEDGALAEMEDLEEYICHRDLSLMIRKKKTVTTNPPTGENLLDDESRAKLPELVQRRRERPGCSGQVKFFTPDSNWTWYASEFDGEDLYVFGDW